MVSEELKTKILQLMSTLDHFVQQDAQMTANRDKPQTTKKPIFRAFPATLAFTNHRSAKFEKKFALLLPIWKKIERI